MKMSDNSCFTNRAALRSQFIYLVFLNLQRKFLKAYFAGHTIERHVPTSLPTLRRSDHVNLYHRNLTRHLVTESTWRAKS